MFIIDFVSHLPIGPETLSAYNGIIKKYTMIKIKHANDKKWTHTQKLSIKDTNMQLEEINRKKYTTKVCLNKAAQTK